jgi:cysteine desulfuration protein SufE
VGMGTSLENGRRLASEASKTTQAVGFRRRPVALPARLARTVRLFAGAPKDLKLQALLEYSRKVPPLPARYAEHPEALERVTECQTPFFLAAEVADDRRVSIAFDCPPEAPTTRASPGSWRTASTGRRPRRCSAYPTTSTWPWAWTKRSLPCACGA